MRFPREATYARQRVRECVRACAPAYGRGPKGTFDPYPSKEKICTKTQNTPQPIGCEKYSPIRVLGGDIRAGHPGKGIQVSGPGPVTLVVPDSGTALSAAKGAAAHDIPLRAEISRFVLRGTSRLVLRILQGPEQVPEGLFQQSEEMRLCRLPGYAWANSGEAVTGCPHHPKQAQPCRNTSLALN